MTAFARMISRVVARLEIAAGDVGEKGGRISKERAWKI